MFHPFKSISKASLMTIVISAPLLISSISATKKTTENVSKSELVDSKKLVVLTAKEIILRKATSIYDELNLKAAGLNEEAFLLAWQGYQNLLTQGKLQKESILSICDFSQSSRKKRLYIVDLEEKKLLVNTYVAHGRNSGGEYAKSFSNKMDSHKSSLGFYITGNTYMGGHGLALNLSGVEKGINDKAKARKIVVHGSNYIGANFIKYNKFNGRSFGCPAIPARETKKIIQTIKNGTCLFIYHPNKKYMEQSSIINS